MKLQVLKNNTFTDESKLPECKSLRATGYDVVATSDPKIVGDVDANGYYRSIDYIEYDTNLFVSVQKNQIFTNKLEIIDYDILAFPRSSVSKYNLTLANCIGLIDADYRGEIKLRFKYQWQPNDYICRDHEGVQRLTGQPNMEKIYKRGDAVCQLKATRVHNIEFELVDVLDSTDRGHGGFGSTTNPKTAEASGQMSMIASLYSKSVTSSESPKPYIQKIKELENI